MRLEKISLLIAAVCAVIVLAVPFFRGFAASQIRQINSSREKSIWTGDINPAVQDSHPKTDAQLIKEHPKDFLLRLAIAQEALIEMRSSKRTKQGISKLLRDYPEEGAVYSIAAKLPEYADLDEPRRIEGSGMTPEEAARDWHPKPATQKQINSVQHYIDLLDKAIIADPGNGWFHYTKSYYLHSLHRDSEARREMHLSAIAPRFIDYTDVQIKAIDHIYKLRGGFDPIGKANAKAMAEIQFLSDMREEARITTYFASKEIRQGNIDQGIHTALDLTDSGYKMAKNAQTTIHALAGQAIHSIGAGAFKTTFKPDETKSIEAQQAARFASYKQFLTDHGYSREGTAIEKQWQQSNLYTKKMRAFFDSDKGKEYHLLEDFYLIFIVNNAILTVSLLFIGVWIIASLFTLKGGAKGLWDKRAAITSSLLIISSLVITDLALVQKQENWSDTIFMFPMKHPASSAIFLTILGVGIIALLTGLYITIRRAPKDGENRKMPMAAIITAYLAAFGGLVYMTCCIDDSTLSNSISASLQDGLSKYVIFSPIIAMILYALLRAVQSRFGRIKKSAPLTFIATIRYASAIAVGLFSIAYLCMMLLTAHYGTKADVVARNYSKHETAIIHSVFK